MPGPPAVGVSFRRKRQKLDGARVIADGLFFEFASLHGMAAGLFVEFISLRGLAEIVLGLRQLQVNVPAVFIGPHIIRPQVDRRGVVADRLLWLPSLLVDKTTVEVRFV